MPKVNTQEKRKEKEKKGILENRKNALINWQATSSFSLFTKQLLIFIHYHKTQK